MKVGEAGGAFFVVKTGLPVPSEYVTSPLAHGSVLNEEVGSYAISLFFF